MYTHPLYHWPPKLQWTEQPSTPRRWNSFSCYIHFPFCRHLCDFCGYETRLLSRGAANSFSNKAASQILLHAASDDFGEGHLRSVFFGGGTASLMPVEGISEILAALKQCVRDAAHEITLECEPGTINRTRLQAARDCGVNRVSVCAQSFNDTVLKSIGRKHTNEQSMQLIEDCVEVGIQNIHLDLIYGLPGQTERDWEDTLRKACSLPIHHISTYKLYVFKHGSLERDRSLPRSALEPECMTNRMCAMEARSREILTDAGFTQYTLTEYCRVGYQSAYITNCFDGGDVLPIGPSAFGRCGRQLWENSPYVHLYGKAEQEVQHTRALTLCPPEAFKRDVILGLWLLNVSISDLAARYNIRIEPELVALLRQLDTEDLIKFERHELSLKGHQRFYAGKPMERLAELPAHRWGVAGLSKEERPTTTKSRASTSALKSLSTLVRMARRDPTLFKALKADPEGTLHHLGYRLSEPDIRAFIDTINLRFNVTAKTEVDDLRYLWDAVQTEHDLT